MDLKQLEYFVSAAEELNFSRAANRCHVVQSAISTSIRALERELDVTLFDRSTHRVTLTHEGEVLLEHSYDVFRSVDAARGAIMHTDGQLRGIVRIGVMQGAWKGMTEALVAMKKAHPLVAITLRQAPAVDLFRDVNSGDLDVAIGPLRKDRQPGLIVRELYREQLVALTTPGTTIASMSQVSFKDLAVENLIDFCPLWALRDIVDSGFDRAAVARTTSYEINDVTVGFSLVAAGLGVMLVPQHLARMAPELIQVNIAEEISWRIGVIVSSRASSAPTAAFVDFLV